MKRLLLLSLGFSFLFGCKSYPPPVDVRFLDDTDLEGTVSAVGNFPEANSIEVPTTTEVYVDFSDKIKPGSVDSFRFQVADEFGVPVKGKKFIEKNGTRLRFEPREGSKRAKFRRSTTYTVHARYLEDKSGYLVGSFSFKFRTVDKMPNSGSFYIKKIYPSKSLMYPGQTMGVTFSEEVALAPDHENGCSDSFWTDAFQILKAPLLSEETGWVPVSGKVCRIYNEDTSKWDTLTFVPDNDESILQGGEYVEIVVRPTPNLRGAISDDELPEDGGDKVRGWVIPVDLLIDTIF